MSLFLISFEAMAASLARVPHVKNARAFLGDYQKILKKIIGKENCPICVKTLLRLSVRYD
jgi:hypothetical protein